MSKMLRLIKTQYCHKFCAPWPDRRQRAEDKREADEEIDEQLEAELAPDPNNMWWLETSEAFEYGTDGRPYFI